MKKSDVATSIQVNQWLKSNYCIYPAYLNGVAMENGAIGDVNEFCLLYGQRLSWWRFIWGYRRAFIGKITLRNEPWRIDVFGQENFDSLRAIGVSLSVEFNVPVEVFLKDEATLMEQQAAVAGGDAY